VRQANLEDAHSRASAQVGTPMLKDGRSHLAGGLLASHTGNPAYGSILYSTDRQVGGCPPHTMKSSCGDIAAKPWRGVTQRSASAL
jgi:hypothetical protein